MFSFIIIGRNEGGKLSKCINSCHQFAHFNHLNYEIIYVDSQSTDNSLDTAIRNNVHKTLSLESPCNAAKARNLGAQNASGDYLIFVDGDMVLYKEFGSKIIKDGQLVHPFVNGQRIDFFYDDGGLIIDSNLKSVNSIKNDVYKIGTGGLFAINKDLWFEVNGMDSRLMSFEDVDLAYRIYRERRIKVLNIGAIFAEHHTIDYRSRKRYYKLAFSNYFFYKGMVFRKNIFSSLFTHILVANNSFSILLLSVIFSFLLRNPIMLLLYLVAIIIKLFFIQTTPNTMGRIERFIIDIYIDIKTLLGLLFFYPK